MHKCQVRRSGCEWRAKGSLVRIFSWTQASCSRSFAHWKLLGRLLEIQRRPEHSWLPDQKEGLVSKVFSPSLGPCRWRTLLLHWKSRCKISGQNAPNARWSYSAHPTGGAKCSQCAQLLALTCIILQDAPVFSSRAQTKVGMHREALVLRGVLVANLAQGHSCLDSGLEPLARQCVFSLMARSPWKSLPSLWIVRSSSSSSDDEWRVEWNWSCSAAFRGMGAVRHGKHVAASKWPCFSHFCSCRAW